MKECCGNCLHFAHEDATGEGVCFKHKQMTHCSFKCNSYKLRVGIWRKLTLDDIDEFDADITVVTDGISYRMAKDMHASLNTLAKVGCYYYYVLPELKKAKL